MDSDVVSPNSVVWFEYGNWKRQGMDRKLITLSRFLSLILRHQPEAIGLILDSNGWADVEDLIERVKQHRKDAQFTRQMLDRIVAENDKQRFAFSDDGTRIRASQGHSVNIELGISPAEPPEFLYHGTATRFLDSIRATGLLAGSRQHVHLSLDIETATKVGKRHGSSVVLQIKSREMFAAGHLFFLSANNVWLTENVPIDFLVIPE